MNPQLHVLIIEDDFRVADINRELVEQLEGYSVVGVAKTGDEAISQLKNVSPTPDLVLLDVFIPDRTGLELFWEIRLQFPAIAIIMVTAARESDTLSETVRGGVFDYLLKPVDFDRFAQSLQRFREQRSTLTERMEWDQQGIDLLFGVSSALPVAASGNPDNLPKGIDQLTLEGVRSFLNDSSTLGVNAMEAGKAVGVSRSTARRYLEHLVSGGEAKAQLNYGEIGRPERRYIPWTK